MSVTYLIEFAVKPTQRERFLHLLDGVLDAMRKEATFRDATLHGDPADPNHFLLHETWADHQDVVEAGPDGRVAWYVLPNGTWNGTTYSGPFYSTSGSAWLGAAYDANKLTVSETGTMSLSFNGSNSAIMTYTFTSGPFAGTTQRKQIVRQAF